MNNATATPTDGYGEHPAAKLLEPKPTPQPTSSLTVSDVRRLESAALATRAGLNGAVTLLEAVEQAEADSGDLTAVVAAYQSLHRIFDHCVDSGVLNIAPSSFSVSSASSPLGSQLQEWLHALYARYVDVSLAFLAHAHPSLHLSALHSLLALSKLQCAGAGDNAASSLSMGLFSSAMIAILSSPSYTHLQDPLMSQYLLPHADLQLYAFRILKRAVLSVNAASPSSSSSPSSAVFPNALAVLLALSSPSVEAATSCYVLPPPNQSSVHKALSDAWFTLLSIRHTVPVYKLLLSHVDTHIIPRVSSPLLLADFLTDSFSIGGVVALLSLSSLFTLMSRFGLDYPHFYHRLYALCTPQVTQSKYRHRFFRLLGVFLGSAYLPRAYVAAFVKRLSRVALLGGVDSGVVLLAIVFNLVRRHRGVRELVGREQEILDDRKQQMDSLTAFLVRRQQELTQQPQQPQQPVRAPGDSDSDSDSISDDAGPPRAPTVSASESTGAESSFAAALTSDPFDAVTSELEHSRAEESTLWEVRTLTLHYDPTLSSLAAMFFADNAPKRDLDVSAYDGLSYEALKAKELQRRRNQKVPVAYTKRTTLFADDDSFLQLFRV